MPEDVVRPQHQGAATVVRALGIDDAIEFPILRVYQFPKNR